MAVRLAQLYVGLVLFGASCAMVILAGLGNAPWDVLHEGLALQFGLGTGWWAILASVAVMLVWIPLRERPGLGTISNAIVVGLVIQVGIDFFPPAERLLTQVALTTGGVALGGVAGAMYIGAGFGSGPRDGLMTGIARRGLPMGVVRIGIEVGVLIVGVLLGGTFGPGTVLYAVAIGPIVQVALPRLRRPREPRRSSERHGPDREAGTRRVIWRDRSG